MANKQLVLTNVARDLTGGQFFDLILIDGGTSYNMYVRNSAQPPTQPANAAQITSVGAVPVIAPSGGGDVVGLGTTNNLMLWTDGPNSVAGNAILKQLAGNTLLPTGNFVFGPGGVGQIVLPDTSSISINGFAVQINATDVTNGNILFSAGGVTIATLGVNASLLSDSIRFRYPTDFGRLIAGSDGNFTFTDSSLANGNLTLLGLTLTGTITFPDDIRQTFNPGATVPGLNVGSNAGDPSTPANGDIWYDSTGNLMRARINGATVSLGGAAAPLVLTGTSAADFAVGPNGNTNPVFRINDSTASQADGIVVTGLASGNGTTITALSPGGNSPIQLIPKGTSAVIVAAGNSIGVAQPGIGFAGATTTGFSGTGSALTSIVGGFNYFQISASGGNFVKMISGLELGWTNSGTDAGAGTVDIALVREAAGLLQVNSGVANTYRDIKVRQYYADQTITAGGTTGNQTINKSAGTVNIAATGTTVTVTNSLCTTSSTVYAVIRTADATARITNVVPGAGSFVINIVACTAEVSIGFLVVN